MNSQRQIIQSVDNDSEIRSDAYAVDLPVNMNGNQLFLPLKFIAKYFTKLCQCIVFRKLLQTQKQNNYSQLKLKKSLDVPEQDQKNKNKKTLVLDLDETLVHSSFTPVPNPDFEFRLSLENQNYVVFVKVRPGAIKFMKQLAKDYEIIIYTASISEYANPVIDYIDPDGIVSLRLFRENCTFFKNVYVKDLSFLNRKIQDIIIIDNSPNSFMFQPMNALQIRNYFDDPNDHDLDFILPFLKLIKNFQDVRPVHEYWNRYINCDKIIYTNLKGKKIEFQLLDDDGQDENNNEQDYSRDQSQLSDVVDGQLNNNSIPNLIIKNQLQPIQQEQGGDQLSTQKEIDEEENLKQIIRKQRKFMKCSQNTQYLQKNVEFIQELESRIGISTEAIGNYKLELKHQQRKNKGIQLRQQLNINSPKDSTTKKQNIFHNNQQ